MCPVVFFLRMWIAYRVTAGVILNVLVKKLRHTNTHACQILFIFYGKEKSLRMFFLARIFPRLFSLMPQHVNSPSGQFPSHAYAKSIYFLSPSSHSPSTYTPPGPEFLSKYLLFDDALHIPAQIFPSLPYTFCVPFAEKKNVQIFAQSKGRGSKEYRIYHYKAEIFLHCKRSTLFSLIFLLPLLFLACPVQRKISNYFFLQTDVIPPLRIFKIK